MNNIVYLLPGRGNKLSDLGKIITSLGFDVYGRELCSPFLNFPFQKQLDIIKKDLKKLFLNKDAKLIGHSYGAYLLLHALFELKDFPSQVILFSPILGAAIDKQNLYMSYPPRADKLLNLAEIGEFPVLQSIEIHTGANDQGCDPILAQKIATLIPNASITILPNQGHQLQIGYIKQALYIFLKEKPNKNN